MWHLPPWMVVLQKTAILGFSRCHSGRAARRLCLPNDHRAASARLRISSVASVRARGTSGLVTPLLQKRAAATSLFADELRHTGRVRRAHGCATPRPWYHVLTNRSPSGASGQIDERFLGIVEVVDGAGNPAPRDTQKRRDSHTIGKQPTLYLADCHAETHVLSRGRKPLCPKRRRAFEVVIEVHQNYPG